jgi:TolB-like protein
MENRKKTYMRLLTLLFAAVALFPACRGGYSFTGTSISPDIKTVSISYFPDMALNSTVPTLSNTFTEALINKFRRQTKLELVNDGGDLHFEGEITGFDVVSKAVQADEMAALNTLKITVKVRFTNTMDEKQSYDQSFSAEADFSATQSQDEVQDRLSAEIVDILVENVFNAAVANW